MEGIIGKCSNDSIFEEKSLRRKYELNEANMRGDRSVQFCEAISLAVVFFIVSSASWGQPSVVSFEKGSFKVNGHFFFPIGWYGGVKEDFPRMKKDGATVVVQYWQSILQEYSTTHATYPFDASDAGNYQQALVNYLDEVHRNGLMAFVHLPTESAPGAGQRARLMDESFIRAIVGDPRIRDHPALLGWYHGDEVDLAEHDPEITEAYLARDYRTIKTADTTHPVFIVFWGKTGFLRRFPGETGRVYDVLGTDRYPATVGSSAPTSDIKEIREAAKDLSDVFQLQTSNEKGGMLFICQGYGFRNAAGKINPAWDTLHSFGRRNPTPQEAFYSALSPVYWAQERGSGNLGGLLFWDYDYADTEARGTIGTLMHYFAVCQLGSILSASSQRDTSFSPRPVYSMVRRVGDTCYLFTINEGSEAAGPVQVEVRLGNPITSCDELTFPKGTPFRKNVRTISPGVYQLADRWSALQVRIYQLR